MSQPTARASESAPDVTVKHSPVTGENLGEWPDARRPSRSRQAVGPGPRAAWPAWRDLPP